MTQFITFYVFLVLTHLNFLSAACTSNSDWFNDWMEGCDLSKEKNYQTALFFYSRAIESLGDDAASFLHLYNERGSLYSTLEQYENALSDYTYVINSSDKINADVISAWWGRFTSYIKMEDLKQCDLHYKTLQEIDPSFPSVTLLDDCMLIKSCYHFTENDRITLAKIMVAGGMCDDESDLKLSPSGVFIVHCPNFLNKYCPCIGNSESIKPFAIDPHKVERCKDYCSTAEYYAILACAQIPNLGCRLFCLSFVHPLRWACNWCCETGDFYQRCIEPLVKFAPPPCKPVED